jgi:hypothetical protein
MRKPNNLHWVLKIRVVKRLGAVDVIAGFVDGLMSTMRTFKLASTAW